MTRFVPSKSNKQKKMFLFSTVFCWHLEGQWRNKRIRIHLSEAWIRGSGSTPKCHGSATLLNTVLFVFDSLRVKSHIEEKIIMLIAIFDSWRQCFGSMTFWCRSGSASWIRILLFAPLTFKMPTITYFLSQFFLLITFWSYIYIIFRIHTSD